MSLTDYKQTFDDHRSLLILVRPVGAIKVATFNEIFDQISAFQDVVCPLSSDSSPRYLRLRFKRTYPVENNAWGEFQAHRKVVGLLCVTTFATQKEFEEAYRHYEILRDKYASSLFDSRILLLWNGDQSDRRDSREEQQQSVEDEAGGGVEKSGSVASSASASDTSPRQEMTESISDKKDSLLTQSTDNLDGVSPSEMFPPNILMPKEERRDFLTISHGLDEDGSSSPVRHSSSLPPCSPNREISLAANRLVKEEKDISPEKMTDVIDDPLRGADGDASPLKEEEDYLAQEASAPLSPPSFAARKGALTLMTSSRADISDGVGDLADSLFWALESRCIDVSLDRQPALVMAPFEKKEFVGVDADSRNHRRRCQGRHLKQMADLFLQAGLPEKAIYNYQSALDILRNINDFLWMGGAEEGVAIASAIVHYKLQLPARGKGANLDQRANPDLLVLKGKKSLKGSAENDALTTNAAQPTQPTQPPQSNQIQKVLAHHRSGSHGSAGVSTSGGSAERGDLTGSNGSLAQAEPDLSISSSPSSSSSALTPGELVDVYKEAVIHYSKCRHAGIIEMEASIKATQVLILQKKFLLAHDFLQNVIYINLQLTDEEKISRYTTLSDLYTSTGFHRKAAFFRRVAAMQCVAPSNPRPTWQQCFDLLLDTMKGYKFDLDHKKNVSFGKAERGWPILQKRLLHELVFTARKMGQLEVAVRLLILYLECLHHDMKDEEISQMTELLSSYAQRTNNATLNLPFELSRKGFVIPPVSLTWLPELAEFSIVPMKPGHAPVTIPTSVNESVTREAERGSPFIYSPLNLRSPGGGESKKSDGKAAKAAPTADLVIAKGDLVSFSLAFKSPVSFDVTMNKLRLSASEGFASDALENGLVLGGTLTANQSSTESTNQSDTEAKRSIEAAVATPTITTVALTGVGENIGRVDVHGYELEIFGVKNSILFSDLPLASKVHLPTRISVVPDLPLIALDLVKAEKDEEAKLDDDGDEEFEPAKDFEVTHQETIPYLPLFNKGQRSKCVLSGRVEVFAGESRQLLLTITNHGRVPLENVQVSIEPPAADTSRTRLSYSQLLNSCFSYDSSILDSALPLPPGGVAQLPVQLKGVFESGREAESPAKVSPGSLSSSPTIITALLSLSYSGGAGFVAGFCRHAALALELCVLPSVIVTQNCASAPCDVEVKMAASDANEDAAADDAAAVTSSVGTNVFTMSLKLQNSSGRNLQVWATRAGHEGSVLGIDGNERLVSPNEEMDLSLQLPRIRFPDLTAVNLDGITARQALGARRRQFAEFISDLVQVCWKDKETGIHGTVQLNRLTWDEASLCAMSIPLVQFQWSSPSPVLSLGNVSQLSLATSLQFKEEEEEMETVYSQVSLSNLRLEFTVEPEEEEEEEEREEENICAFFVGSRVFKHSQGPLPSESLVTNLNVVPVKLPKTKLLKISCRCTATIKDAICEVIEEPWKSSGRRASWKLKPQIVEIRA